MLFERLLILGLTAGLPLISPLALTLFNAGDAGGVWSDFAADPLAPQSALFGIAGAALLAFSPLPKFRLDILGLLLLAALLGVFAIHARSGPLSIALLGLAFAWTARRLADGFLERYLRFSCAVATAVALYGIVQSAWNRVFPGVALINPFGERILSTLGNPTFLADYLALQLPLALALAFAASGIGRFLGFGACAAAIAAAIMLTGSKGGQIAAGVSTCLLLGYALYRRQLSLPRVAILSGLALAAVAGLLLFTSSLRFSFSRWASPDQSFSYSQRFEIARSALRLLARSPLLGHGLGSFPVLFPESQSPALDRELGVSLSVNHAHNDFIELGADLGIPALGLFLAAGLLCLRAGRLPFPAAGLAFSLLAGSIAMLANFLIFLPTSLFFLCVHSGLLLPTKFAGAALGSSFPVRAFRLLISIWFATAAAGIFLATGWYDLGAKAVGAGNLPSAQIDLKKALVFAPDNRHVWQNLGRAYELEGNWPKAVNAYSEAVRLGPHHAITHLNLGRAEWGWYYASREPVHLERSLNYLAEAVRLNPYRADAREWGGELSLATDRSGPAKGFLDGFPAEFSATPRLLWLRAKWLNSIGRTQAAAEAMQEGDILAAQVEIVRAEKALASAKPAEAERIARSLAERFPHLVVAWEALGYVLSARGKATEARDCFARILQIDPGFLPALLNVALLSLNLEDLPAARKAWRQATRLAPDDPEVRLTHARILAREGKLQEAKGEYSWIIERFPENAQARKELESFSAF